MIFRDDQRRVSADQNRGMRKSQRCERIAAGQFSGREETCVSTEISTETIDEEDRSLFLRKWNCRFFLNVRVRHLITTDRVFSWSSVKEHPGGPEGRQKARGWITLTDQKRADHSILLHSRSSSFAPTGEIDQSETTLRSTPIEGSSSTL